MNVPYSWLKDLVELNVPATQLAERMTMAGLEAENIEEIGAEWDKVYVGLVTTVEQHPDADKLVLATVEAGDHKLTVVTGAPNIAEGQKIALALAGANLVDAYSNEPGKRKTLKPGKIRGIVSEGMVCSEKELGISDGHEGILVLEDDAPVGVPLKDYLGDTVIEFEITPNLVHAFSMRGIASEASAIMNTPVSAPKLADLTTAATNAGLVTIDAPDLCARYLGVIIDGVTVEPSPSWLTKRLTAAGVRPVNNLVDVTNYVMLEVGQPLHAFDLRNVADQRIVVRRARDGEAMETLDHVKRTFTTDDLLITDGEKPVAVAGVMGGVNSEVVDDTTSILLESANFDMVAVRQTARRLKLRTDASARFERGLDPNLAEIAARRATRLILELCPDATIRNWDDEYPAPVTERTISLPLSTFGRTLGMDVETDTIEDVLTRLRFQPTVKEETLSVTVPTDRPDVTIPADIVEEVARIVGYDALPATLIEGETPVVLRDPLSLLERKARIALAASGYHEGRSYVTVNVTDARRWYGAASGEQSSERSVVHLMNPMNAEQPVLRTSLLPRLIDSVGENLKHERSVRLFEIGHVYLATEPDELPTEPTYAAIAAAGFRQVFDRFAPRQDKNDQIDFFDVKGALELMLHRTGFTELTWDAASHDALHPGRTARVSVKGQQIGFVGEVRPDLARGLGVEDMRLVVAELDLTAVLNLLQGMGKPVIRVDHYLPVEQDFAIVVDKGTSAADVELALRRNAGPLLTRIVLFDVFEGEQIGEDKKSLAYRLTFTAPDRAMTDAELEKQRKKIEKGIRALVGGTIRS